MDEQMRTDSDESTTEELLEGHVQLRLDLHLIDGTGQPLDLSAMFGYVAEDPYAVSVTFYTDGPEVTWSFARDLLARGLVAPTGSGDVQLWPLLSDDGQPLVAIELVSPGGEAVLQARSADIADFVSATTALVPAGTESDHLDLDGLVEALLTA